MARRQFWCKALKAGCQFYKRALDNAGRALLVAGLLGAPVAGLAYTGQTLWPYAILGAAVVAAGLGEGTYEVWRDAELRAVASAATGGIIESRASKSPAERLDGLTAKGHALRESITAGLVQPSVVSRRVASWNRETTELLDEVSPMHIVVLRGWRSGASPEETSTEQERQLWFLDNYIQAAQDIARRLRAHAGEDVGVVSTRKALLKDLLLNAHHEVRILQERNAPLDEFREWEAELSCLLHLALPDVEAGQLLDRSAIDGSGYGSGTLGPEELAILRHSGQICWHLQEGLDSIDINEGFDPRDWRGRWT